MSKAKNSRAGSGNALDRKAQGDRLRELYESCGKRTASDAARALNVPVPTFLSYVNGSRQIPNDKARDFAAAYHSTPEWILYGTGPMKKGLESSTEISAAGRQLLADVMRLVARVFEEKSKLTRGELKALRSSLEILNDVMSD